MGHVWYVAYGSNMSAARLTCYLEGGCPAGGVRSNPGARDRTPPVESRPIDLPGTTYFAGQSPQWGGGVAFYDPRPPPPPAADDPRPLPGADDPGPAGGTAARGYLITAGQLADIVAQEMYRQPRDGDPVEAVLLGPLDEERYTYGPGRYETLVVLGQRRGLPLVTFTAPHGGGGVTRTRPAAAYIAAMARGLAESRGWSETEIGAYLDRLQA